MDSIDYSKEYRYVLLNLVHCKDTLSKLSMQNSLLYRSINTLIDFISDLL